MDVTSTFSIPQSSHFPFICEQNEFGYTYIITISKFVDIGNRDLSESIWPDVKFHEINLLLAF